jgi:hypothetical protein
LQRGVWQGRQLLPAAWVADASAVQTVNGANPKSDWEQGYGYQFWRCRHAAYRADGAFGQFCVILPDQGAVAAITAGTPDMQAVLNLIWQHLLPALGPAPLPHDGPAHAALQRRLAGLALPVVAGAAVGPRAADVSGKRYAFAGKRSPLQTITFDFGADADRCTVRDQAGAHQVICGRDAWVKGSTTWNLTRPRGAAAQMTPIVQRPVAASGAWTAADTYEMRLCYPETPFLMTLVCKFGADTVKLKFRLNVSFGPTEFPELTGRLDVTS